MPKVIKETVFTDCPIRNVLARISGKWSLLVLYTLDRNGMSPMRFNQLRRAIPDISQKVLTTTLRTLETDGLICRKVFSEVPPRVEYSLTEHGRSIRPVLEAMYAWGASHWSTRSSTGRPITWRTSCATGRRALSLTPHDGHCQGARKY